MTRRRRRKKPLKEGSLKEIIRLFIHPLYKQCKNRYKVKDFMEHFFHVKERDIQEYICVKNMNIPGYFVLAPFVLIQGGGYRKIKKGQVVLIRQDITDKDSIDIEVFSGQGGKNQVFRLTEDQWKKVRRFFVVLPTTKSKREKVYIKHNQ